MSVKLMGQVWELDLSHTHTLVVLALADHADHEGGNIYPSIGLIAWKVGYSERQVQRVIRELERRGILVKMAPASGRRPNLYRMDLSGVPHKAPYTTPTGDTAVSPVGGDIHDTRGDTVSPDTVSGVTQLCHRRGDIHDTRGDTCMSPDPSWEPSENRQIGERAHAPTPAPAAPTAPAASPHAPPGAPRIEQPNIPEQQPASPAAEAFRTIYPRAKPLTPEQHQAIRETVTDLEVWQATLELFRLNGWKPAIGNILDRYRKDASHEANQPRRSANRHASPTSPAAGVPLGTPPPPGSPRVYKPWELEEIRARRVREREIADAARAHAVA